MIQSANERHFDGILDIEKLIFTQQWIGKQLNNDLTLIINEENWIYLEVTGKINQLKSCLDLWVFNRK